MFEVWFEAQFQPEKSINKYYLISWKLWFQLLSYSATAKGRRVVQSCKYTSHFPNHVLGTVLCQTLQTEFFCVFKVLILEHLQLTILFLIKISVVLDVCEYGTFDYNQTPHVSTQNYKIRKQMKNLVFLKAVTVFLLHFFVK